MMSTTVGLGLDNLKGTIDIKVKSKVCLGAVGEDNLLDLLWGIALPSDRPVLHSEMILSVHFQFAVDGQSWVDGVSI